MQLDADCRTRSDGGRPAADAARWFAAHELRTPLQGIQGGVALLLEEQGAGLSPLQLEAIGLISAATAQLERCVTRLAELADVAASPAAPRRALTLSALLEKAALRCGLRRGPGLAAAAGLDVLVAPDLVRRAFEHLAALAATGGDPQGLECELAAVDDETIALDLAVAPSPGGDGTVAWHLAAALAERAGGLLEAGDARTRLVLQRPNDLAATDSRTDIIGARDV